MIAVPVIANNPLSLNTTLAAYIATSDVIDLPSFTTPLRRLRVNASSTSTIIHVIMVVRTARTISTVVPTRTTVLITRNGIESKKDINIRIKIKKDFVVIVTFIFCFT